MRWTDEFCPVGAERQKTKINKNLRFRYISSDHVGLEVKVAWASRPWLGFGHFTKTFVSQHFVFICS
jgi:hypothetical protein